MLYLLLFALFSMHLHVYADELLFLRSFDQQLTDLQKKIDHPVIHMSFSEWYKLIYEQKPLLDEIGVAPRGNTIKHKKYTQTIISYELFTALCEKTIAVLQNNINNKNAWVGQFPDLFLQKAPGYAPFMQRYTVASGTKIAAWGDLHGSIFSLLHVLNTLKADGYLNDDFTLTAKDTIHFLFLGDYSDRGWNSIEVFVTLMRLKIANPQRVLIVRGNHEDVDINMQYGLADEILKKFSQTNLKPTMDILNGWYNLLPCAFYIAGEATQLEYMLCCHGGCDLAVSSRPLLVSDRSFMTFKKPVKLDADVFELQVPETIEIGFMWNDFQVDPTQPTRYNSGRGFALGSEVVTDFLDPKKSLVRSILRAHQHNNNSGGPMLTQLQNTGGMVRLWTEPYLVTTLLSAPEAGLGFNWHSYVMLTVASTITGWNFDHRKEKIASIKTPFGWYAPDDKCACC